MGIPKPIIFGLIDERMSTIHKDLLIIHFEKKHLKCKLPGDSDNTEHGQWTWPQTFNDNIFNCLNRKDENPYVKIGKKPWDGNKTCTKKNYRRCIGQRSDLCIDAAGKFYT